MTETIAKELMQAGPVKTIMQILGAHEGKTRFVGGAVRDALLEKTIKDIDIATTLLPDEVTNRLTARNIKVIPTGIAHGTVTAVIGEDQYEITTLRRDVACDGRHAEVEYTTNWEEDAARRDFTINAMSCTPDGTIYDYFTGKQDINEGILRFVGDPNARIKEDALRILRFFRFAACYDLTQDADALIACSDHAADIANLSGERIQAEMFKLLIGPNAVKILDIMQDLGILDYLLLQNISTPCLEALYQLEKELCYPINPIGHIIILLRSCPAITSEDLDKLSERWKLSNQCKAIIQHFVLTDISLSPDTTLPQQRKILRAVNKYAFLDMILIHWAEALAENPNNSSMLREKFCDMIALAEHWNPPVFPITGDDLMALGVSEGKPVGKWLKTVESWWEESDYLLTKEEIVAKLKVAL